MLPPTQHLQALSARASRLAAVTAVVATGATALLCVPAADATNESYGCSNCETVNGHDNWVTNAEAVNYTRRGVAAIVWRKNSNGSYTQITNSVGTGYSTIACAAPTEVFGHGEAHTSPAGHIAGRQDNFRYCG